MGKIIITINRESGSGGRKIAFRLGELLGIKVYDKAAIEGIKTYKPENKKITSRESYYTQTQKMRDLATNESCIFVGRTGFRVFKDDPNALKIFIFADRDIRIKKWPKNMVVMKRRQPSASMMSTTPVKPIPNIMPERHAMRLEITTSP